MEKLTLEIPYPGRMKKCQVTVERDDDYRTMVRRVIESVPLDYLDALLVAGEELAYESRDQTLRMGVFILSQHYLNHIGEFESLLPVDECYAFMLKMVNVMKNRLRAGE